MCSFILLINSGFWSIAISEFVLAIAIKYTIIFSVSTDGVSNPFGIVLMISLSTLPVSSTSYERSRIV